MGVKMLRLVVVSHDRLTYTSLFAQERIGVAGVDN